MSAWHSPLWVPVGKTLALLAPWLYVATRGRVGVGLCSYGGETHRWHGVQLVVYRQGRWRRGPVIRSEWTRYVLMSA